MLRRSKDRRSERQSRRSEAIAQLLTGSRTRWRGLRKGHATIRKNWATTRTNGSECALEFFVAGIVGGRRTASMRHSAQEKFTNASLTRPMPSVGTKPLAILRLWSRRCWIELTVVMFRAHSVVRRPARAAVSASAVPQAPPPRTPTESITPPPRRRRDR